MRIARCLVVVVIAAFCGGCNAGNPGSSSDGGDVSGDAVDGGDTSQLRAGCAKQLFGQYLLREDGRLLLELDTEGAEEAVQLPVVLDTTTDEPLSDVRAASQGLRHGCALVGSSQTVWCWRAPRAKGNDCGQLGSGIIDDSTTALRATQVLRSAGAPLTDVVALSEAGTNGLDATCAVTAAGGVYCWGDLTRIISGGPQKQPYATSITTDGVTPFSGALRVSARAPDPSVLRGHACAVAQANTSRAVWCWGDNLNGGLGVGDKKAREYPTRVPGLTDPEKVLAFSQGPGTTCVIDRGRVLCWGNDDFGKLGNGKKGDDTASPSLVTTSTNQPITSVVDIAAGDDNVCALTQGGAALCWGQGFGLWPTLYPTSGISALGSLGLDAENFRFLTSDGKYHVAPLSGSKAPVVRDVRCGAL